MLDVTASSVETQLDVDFAEIYANSALYQYVHFYLNSLIRLLGVVEDCWEGVPR